MTSKLDASSRKLGVFLLLISVLFCTSGHYLLKKGMAMIGPLPDLMDVLRVSFFLLHDTAVLTVLIGLCLYFGGTVLWLMCLTKLELSFAFPLSTVQYLLVFLAAVLFLNEQIHPARWVGMMIIIAGVLVMSTEPKDETAEVGDA